MEIEETLGKLVDLYSKWNIKRDDWALIFHYSAKLQGFDLPEKKRWGLNTIVRKVPWPVKDNTFLMPPKDSSYFKDYVNFTKETSHGPHMIFIPEPEFSEFLKETKLYKLKSGEQIHITPVITNVKIIRSLFSHIFPLTQFKEEYKDRALEDLNDIKNIAKQKKDKELIGECEKTFEFLKAH